MSPRSRRTARVGILLTLVLEGCGDDRQRPKALPNVSAPQPPLGGAGVEAGSTDAGKSVAASDAAVAWPDARANEGNGATGLGDAGSVPSADGSAVAPSTSDAGLASMAGETSIFEPQVQELPMSDVCANFSELEAQTVDTDLSGLVVLNQAALFPLVTQSADSGASGNDSSIEVDGGVADSGTCGEGYAPYVVACGDAVVLLKATHAPYGLGSTLPDGDALQIGCFTRTCGASECLPVAASQVQSVRVRVVAPVHGLAEFDTSVRAHGIDFAALGALEILELR